MSDTEPSGDLPSQAALDLVGHLHRYRPSTNPWTVNSVSAARRAVDLLGEVNRADACELQIAHDLQRIAEVTRDPRGVIHEEDIERSRLLRGRVEQRANTGTALQRTPRHASSE